MLAFHVHQLTHEIEVAMHPEHIVVAPGLSTVHSINGSPQRLTRASICPLFSVSAKMNETVHGRVCQRGSGAFPLPSHSLVLGSMFASHSSFSLSSEMNFINLIRGFSMAGFNNS